jgi:hypothetical protein
LTRIWPGTNRAREFAKGWAVTLAVTAARATPQPTSKQTSHATRKIAARAKRQQEFRPLPNRRGFAPGLFAAGCSVIMFT